MSVEKAIDKTTEQDNMQGVYDGNKGLHYEENLLWEKERSDHPGVDLPEPEG